MAAESYIWNHFFQNVFILVHIRIIRKDVQSNSFIPL